MSGKGTDSGTARVLGSGASGTKAPSYYGDLTLTPCRCRRTPHFSPRRYRCKASNEQQSQGESQTTSISYWRSTNYPDLEVSMSTLSPIVFRDATTASFGRKLFSLFPGLGYAAGYKIAQRVYKFGGQPWFNDLITRYYKTQFTNTFGERKGKMMMQATAGRCVHHSVLPAGI